MNVLVCGAKGFIGRALCLALEQGGHRVFKGTRGATGPDVFEIDYMTDLDPAELSLRLRDIDVLINAVGILVENASHTFDRVHRRAPIALFQAACRANVKHVVQISALGAHTGMTGYFESKQAADRYLCSLPIKHHVLRPALVYGPDGVSSRFFRAIAAFPIHPLPAGGHQLVRPIHVNDLTEIVLRLVDGRASPSVDRSDESAGEAKSSVFELVGNTKLEYKEMLAVYRSSMAFSPAKQIQIPRWLVDLASVICDRIPGSMLTRDSWRMLERGNAANVDTTACILGRAPAGIEAFISPADAIRLRSNALGIWRSWVLRLALASTWLGTALCSAFVYPKPASLALLARVHVHGVAALGLLYGASATDAMLGILTLVSPGKRLWGVQACVVAAYSVVVAFTLPEFLWHPFGPIIKNVPILALLGVLAMEEVRP